MESITPCSINRGTDLYKTLTMDDNKTDFNQDVYEAQAFLKFVTGWGMQPLNKEYVETVYGFKANGLVKKKGKLRNEIYAAIDSDFNIDRFTNQYIDVNTRYYKEVAKFHKLSDSVSKFNVMPLKVLRDTNMAKSDMVSFLGNKRFKPIGITDNMKLQLVDAAPDYRTFINVYKDILTIDGELSKLPLYYSPDNYKAQKETIQEVKETLRENYKIGGKVPNVQEDPADRKNPYLGESYKETSSALKDFQKALSSMMKPKEDMERLGFSKGGGTLKSDEAMYLKFYKLAKQAGNEFPEAVAAQASLESGHGKSELTTQYKNPLGIKVNRASERKEGQQAVQMKTQEFVKGKEGTYKEPFRVYESLADSFVGYRQKVSAPRYDSIRQAKTSDEYLINIAKSGYATDPKYSEKTINIKNRYAHLIPQE
jgi:flagellum-specific peptidoglycan hydrolase FlgJ